MVAKIQRINFPFKKYQGVTPDQMAAIEWSLAYDISKLEEEYGLPKGRLGKRTTTRGLRYHDKVYLPALKQAVVLKYHDRLQMEKMAKFLGFRHHASIVHAKKAAKGFLKTNDPLFMKAYSIINP